MSVFVVTGGSGGLGSAVVRTLIAAGHQVVVPYRDRGRFTALENGVAAKDRLLGAIAEMDRLEDAERVMAEAVRWGARLDGVAALAGGYASSGALDVAPAQEWEEMLRVNLKTAYSTCRAALPHLSATRGSIVLCSSRAVTTGGAGTAYTVSKAAVEALTRELALESRGRGVRVNAIAPGTIDTPGNRSAMPKADRTSWTPPVEIAAVVAFLLGPESTPVTGAVVPVHAKG